MFIIFNMMKEKHKAIFLNILAVSLLFLETLHFIGSLNIAIGISLVIIAIAITGTIIAEFREEMKFMKEFAEALKNEKS
jgi:ABC-type transport system involved in multi-copper enzyme maturation permease subunit